MESKVDYCLKSIQCGKNCGDLYNAGLSYGPLMWNLQVQGADLSRIEDYAKECLQFSNRYHLSFSVGLAEAMQAGWIEPMKKDYSPVPMEEKLRQWEKDNHVASAGSYFVHMALAHYYFGEYEEAQECLEEVRRYMTGLTDNVLKRQWHVFLVLNALKLYEKGLQGTSYSPQSFPIEGRGKGEFSHATIMARLLARGERVSLGQLMAQIQPLIKKIETWASLGPLLKPYLAFMYAELERVTGDFRGARSLYLDAISAAHQQQYTFLEGHLNECLGELLLRNGQYSEGLYFAEAARLYKKCGAERKEIRLMEKRPEYFEEEKTSYSQFDTESAVSNTLPPLDIDYLMKSSLAISAEMDLDSLLKKIMNVVIESSAAQHGYLLIEEEGNLFVRAESHVAEKQAARTLNQKLDDAQGICKAIVRYVYRTGERVCIDNASQEGMFRDSPEVQNMQLRSVLCLPVIKQSRMIGVLYLENRLSDSVFTSAKTQTTELLTSQAAISIENSRLVEEMKNADEQIKRSLREKEVLLKEIHHRVKNNLQIIHSMLNLQLPFIKERDASEAFKESQNRIHSMALIHEKLYQSESLTRIDLAEYIENLANNLFISYQGTGREIRPKVHVENASLDVDTVIPCALIINELVSNSLKHAFRGSPRRADEISEIGIELRRDGGNRFILTVRDNGVGLPDGFAIDRCESLGLQLVDILVQQLKGTLNISSNGGTEFTITFEALTRKAGGHNE